MRIVGRLSAGLCAVFLCANAYASFSVRDYGAKGDGETKDTSAVQTAIDTAAQAGGGTVLFPAGTYLCGSLHLRSHVTLALDTGSTIKGSPAKEDYDPYEKLDFKNDADIETSYFHFALIWAEDTEHIAITGTGTIDGNRDRRHGPKAIALKRCRFVTIRDVTLINAPNYNISMLGTDFVLIDGVTILNGFADGIDPDSCRDVRIAGCYIECSDDAIVPKTSFALGERRSCENITVTNCHLATESNAFKLGTESGGDFRHVAVSNCVLSGMANNEPARGGIALESVDGAHIDDVAVSNITMANVRAPVFLRLGNRGRDMATPVPGSLHNVVISDITASGASNTCSISGIPGHPVEGVTLANIRIAWKGGCPLSNPEESVPENIDDYPDPGMFDALPAYGFYCRHVEGLRMSNLDLRFDDGFWRIDGKETKHRFHWDADGVGHPSKAAEPGYALFFDDVTHLDLSGLRARTAATGAGTIRMMNVRDTLLFGCAAPGVTHFLEVQGPRSANIHLVSNVLAGKESIVMKDCDPGAVSVAD